jgi:hypothetical protein
MTEESKDEVAKVHGAFTKEVHGAFIKMVKADVAEMIERGDKISTLAWYVRGVTHPAMPTDIAKTGLGAVAEALSEAASRAAR